MFHSFFLHGSNKKLWEVSLASATGLPDRPPFMTIPAFIHLLYSPYCHNCASPNVRHIFWPWFKRYCQKCVLKRSVYLWRYHEFGLVSSFYGLGPPNQARCIQSSIMIFGNAYFHCPDTCVFSCSVKQDYHVLGMVWVPLLSKTVK